MADAADTGSDLDRKGLQRSTNRGTKAKERKKERKKGKDKLQGDWRSKCGTVLERWGEARKRSLFTDVDFLVGKDEMMKPFYAHKNVLSFSSPVFEAMFFGELAETKNPISIVDIDTEAFENLLRFVYGESVVFSSVAHAAKVYIAADKYLINDLQVIAKDYVTKATMNDPQFWEVIQEDRFFITPVVKEKCLEYISKNASTLFKSYLITNISSNVMQVIIKMDKMAITEFELLSALVRWGMGNVQTETKLRKKLEPFLRYIRFSNLTVDEYCKFDDCHPSLLDSSDSLLIMKHLHNKNERKLPHWCSASNKQRNM